MKRSLTDAAREAMNSVVQIYAEGYNDEDPGVVLDPRMISKFRWSGSGFFIEVDAQSGYILTNAHVVRNATSLKIMTVMTSEETFKVQIVGQMKSLEPDIALLKLQDEEFRRLKSIIKQIPSLNLCNTREIKRGTMIKAIGYPLGMVEPNISGGEITNFVSGHQLECERLVTDAAINPGNSGGPSIIEGGEVIGINTSIIMNANNIGFITPIFYVKILLENLVKKGEGTLAQLGGNVQKNSLANAQYLGMEEAQGLIVKEVIKDGFLHKLGVQEKDVLISLNGIDFDRHGIASKNFPPFLKHKNIFDVIRLCPLGSLVSVSYQRQGKNYEAKAPACSNPPTAVVHHYDVFDRSYIFYEGMILQELSFEIINSLAEQESIDYHQLVKTLNQLESSVVITHIDSDGQADDLALEVGDCLLRANSQEVKNLQDFLQVVSSSQKKDGIILLEMSSGAIGYFVCHQKVELIKISATQE